MEECADLDHPAFVARRTNAPRAFLGRSGSSVPGTLTVFRCLTDVRVTVGASVVLSTPSLACGTHCAFLLDSMSASKFLSERVILIPGLWMPGWVMLPLAWRLRSLGMRCTCFGYPSRTGSLAENTDRLAGFVRSLGAEPVHLVGHSLGGVLALHATANRGLACVRSIVMMGSPAQGSYAAMRLAERGWGRRFLGRTVPDWLAATRALAPEGAAVGVIAGTRAFGLGTVFVPDLRRPHDGVVRVAETDVSGASDRVEVPVAHAALLTSGRVAKLVASFILQGSFEAPTAALPPERPAPHLAFDPPNRRKGRPE